MDSGESAANIPAFIATYGVDPSEAELPLDQYRTFNEFFARKLRAGARPISCAEDPKIAVSPADCRILVFPSLDASARLWLKGQPLHLPRLLGPDLAHLVPRYAHGSFVIARLAPNDYHRWHVPFECRVGEQHDVPGEYFSVSPRAVRRMGILSRNKRSVCVLHSPHFGRVIMVAVGAAMVSSIQVVAPPEGSLMQKGDEHGAFRFGGSTLLLLFEPDRIQFDQDLLDHSSEPMETLIRMGDSLGRALPPPEYQGRGREKEWEDDAEYMRKMDADEFLRQQREANAQERADFARHRQQGRQASAAARLFMQSLPFIALAFVVVLFEAL